MQREEQLLPFQTTSLVGATVLVLAPHSDDETIGCGGALALHRAHGDPVKVLVLTDGALAEGPGAGGPDYIALREQETHAALTVLGVEAVEFWRLPDRGLTVDAATVARLIAVLEAYRPTLLYVPSPLEPHPDHAAAAQLVWVAIQQTGIPMSVCLYEVGLPIRPNSLVDITPVLSQKERALTCYASQLKLNDYRSKILGLNRYRSYTLPTHVTHAEAFWRLTPDEVRAASPELIRWQMAGEEEVARVPDLPLVSVIVRTFNRPRFLRECLQSILAQTYRNIEVVVVNDGGQDVEPVLSEFRPFMRITSVAHEQPVGRPGALNAGLKQATGDFIAYLDDDDIYDPNHIETLVNFLRAGTYQAAYTDIRWAYQRLDPVTGMYETYETRQEFSMDFDPDWLLFENYIPINAVMHARQLIEDVGPFDEAFALLEDWELWLRMSQTYPFHHLRICTAEYRIRDDATNATVAPSKQELKKASAMQLFAKFADRRSEAMQRLFEQLRRRLADVEANARNELAKSREELQLIQLELANSRESIRNLERQVELLETCKADLEAERDEFHRSLSFRLFKRLRDILS